jgi:hypothetical protein
MSDQPPITDWKASLPEDLRANPSLATIPDIPTLAKSYVDTKAFTGKKAYELPQPDWKAEQWSAWNKTIGVPEAPDKYSPIDKAVLEKAGLPPEVISSAAAKFHEWGLTDRQAKGLLDWYMGDTIKGRELQEQNSEAERAKGESALRGEFGDKYEARMGLLKAWLSQNGSPEFAEAVDAAGLGSNPAFVKAIIASAEKTMEATGRSGGSPATTGPEAAASALMEIEAMKADMTQMKRYFGGDKEMVAKWRELHKAAYPTPAAKV